MKKYAVAIGILAGGACGLALAIALNNFALVAVGSLLGMVIAMALTWKAPSQSDKRTLKSASERLRELESLHADGLITKEEYEEKKKVIVDEV